MSDDWIEQLRQSEFGKAIREACDKAEDAPARRIEVGWNGVISGFCPVQGWGRVDDRWWYFRARSGEWTFDVYSESTDEGRLLPDDDKIVWSAEGEDPDDGWMPFSEAWRNIEEQIAAYRSSTQHKSNTEER